MFKEEVQLFDDKNKDHENLLKQLWTISFPDQDPPPNLKSKRWQAVGFQGENPRTDFRGGGVVGLQCIVYFFTAFRNNKDEILDKGEEYFFLAASAINLSFALLKVLNLLEGAAPTSLRQYEGTPAAFKNFMRVFAEDKKAFYELHSHLLIALEALWQNEKSNNELNPMHGFNTAFEKTMQICEAVLSRLGKARAGSIGAGVQELIKKYK